MALTFIIWQRAVAGMEDGLRPAWATHPAHPSISVDVTDMHVLLTTLLPCFFYLTYYATSTVAMSWEKACQCSWSIRHIQCADNELCSQGEWCSKHAGDYVFVAQLIGDPVLLRCDCHPPLLFIGKRSDFRNRNWLVLLHKEKIGRNRSREGTWDCLRPRNMILGCFTGSLVEWTVKSIIPLVLTNPL